MLKQNVAVKSFKFIFIDIIADFGYFPIWWYTTGLKQSFFRMLDTVRQADREMALSVWVKSIFKPMFGQYDWQGRLMSFFMRVVQIIFRFLLVCAWFLFAFMIFCAWLILPLFIITEILFNIGLFSVDFIVL